MRKILNNFLNSGIFFKLANNKFDRMVAWKDRKVVDVAISEGISTYKVVDRTDPLIETALALGVYVGDID